MTRVLAVLGLVATLVATPASASRVVLLVDSNRLLELGVRSLYLLPDGNQLDYDRLIRSCGALQTAGWVVYDPGSGVCQQEADVLPPFRPSMRPEAVGIVVFDSVSRQQCSPGACQVIVGAAPADPIFADRFEVNP